MAVQSKAGPADHIISSNQEEITDVGQISSEAALRRAIPESFESSFNNDDAFYNALRISSSNETAPQSILKSTIYDSLDSRTAANVAMLFPLSSEYVAGSVQQQTYEPRRHPHLLSQQSYPQHDTGDSLPKKPLIPGFLEEGHHFRKAFSSNDTSSTSRLPRWPRNIKSPVSPGLPIYPPPIRPPTPPGLPSFGTQEAVSYISQFAHQSSATNRHPQQNTLGVANPSSGGRTNREPRPLSYGEILRRFLGLHGSSSPPQHHGRQTYAAVRAENGTAVLGRFPYRQSGHGMNVSRRINDHPFHRRNLSVAQCDGADADGTHAVSGDPYSREEVSVSHRPFVPADAPNAARIPGTYPQTRPHSFLAVPRPLDARGPSSPDSFIPIVRAESYQTCTSQIPEPGASRQPDVREAAVHSDAEDSSRCFLAPTQSPPPISPPDRSTGVDGRSNFWLETLKKADSILACCFGTQNESEDPMYSNVSSHDTYMTAQS